VSEHPPFDLNEARLLLKGKLVLNVYAKADDPKVLLLDFGDFALGCTDPMIGQLGEKYPGGMVN